MKNIKIAIASIAASFATMTALPAIAADATAMMYYADWCGPCQILDPVLKRAAASYDKAEIEVMHLDFTRMDFDSLSVQVAKADSIGMADQVSLTNIKTGYAVIVVDGEARGRVSAGMDEELIHLMFDAALAK